MPRHADLPKVVAAIISLGLQPIGEVTAVTTSHRFKCFCGQEFETQPYKIVSRHTKSCGCLRGKHRRRGTEHVTGEYFGVVKTNAIRRGLEFAVSIEFLTELLVKQEFCCALSGLPIRLYYNGLKHGQNTASLDRRDNAKGYTPDNVQWVHKDVNWMKQDFDQDYFLSVCERIAKRKAA